jgi:hypothetical protein
MDIVRLRVPYQFIRNRIRMTWPEVLFGLTQELLDRTAPIELAEERLAEEENSDPALIELAGLSRTDDPLPCVEKLAAATDEPTDEIRARWLFVVLAWIFEHKHDYEDPLRAVEEVYADFDYPKRIAGLVRYMPSDEPDLGSRDLNEARMFGKWREYLEQCSRKYAPMKR